MSLKVLKLGDKRLTLAEVREVARQHRKVTLGAQAKKRIQKAHQFLRNQATRDEAIYGVNTGFGLLSSVRIKESEIEILQYNLLRSHAVGTGEPLPEDAVRAMLLLRAQALAQGHSGVSVAVVEALLALLNANVIPRIPEQGSVGASGDLAPLAHLALTLIGEGSARYQGKWMASGVALRRAGLKPIRLGPKEGLALINGTQFMAALGVLALLDAEHLANCADAAGALSLEAMRGTPVAFEPEIHAVRPHPGQIEVAASLQRWLKPESKIAKSHEGCGKVQDPYSLRCMPQVHGASRDVFRFVREVLEREINSVTDNPLVFPNAGAGKILSGGNFHGQIVAMAMDFLTIAAAELASISEQRIEKLVNPAISDLPAFLTPQGGLNSGYMIIQVAAAAIVSENKTLAHPASVDSIPTSADKEDHVSMGAWAARKATLVVRNLRRVLAMELMAGAQGIDLLRPLKSTPRLERLHQQIRKVVPFAKSDRYFHPDIEAMIDQVDRLEV